MTSISRDATSVTEVRQFLGFTNYIRAFIDHYSFIARPLEELTGKYARFSWSKQCHDALAHLKESLTSAPVLHLPDVEREFRLITDASDSAVAGVLLQQDDDKEWHPVAYTSRRLRPEERNYHANERETRAVLHALCVWRMYLFKHFQLLTDNQAVTYLLSKKHLSGREARWLDTLANFDMSITHKPGKDNVADPLSRALDTSPLPSPDDLETNASLGSVIGKFCQDDKTKEQLLKAYHEDVYFKNIIAKLEEDLRNAWKKRYFWSKEKGLFLLEDPVWRLCILKGSLRLKLLRMYHQSASSCHPGRERTYLRLRRYFYCPKLAKSVKQFGKSCDICQRSKGDKPMPNPLQPLPIPKQPREDLSMKFIMGLPTTANGDNAILTFVDRLTKYAHFVPTVNTFTAAGFADLYIRNVYRLHGLSKTIVCGKDWRFTADFFKEIFGRLRVELKFSTAQHPQTDGQTERTHRTIGQILRCMVNHRQNNWEDILPLCEFAYNDMTNRSTQSAPFSLTMVSIHGLLKTFPSVWKGIQQLPMLSIG